MSSVQIGDLPLIEVPVDLPRFTEARCYEDSDGHGHVVIWDHINHVDIAAHQMTVLDLVNAIRFGLNSLEAARQKLRKRLH